MTVRSPFSPHYLEKSTGEVALSFSEWVCICCTRVSVKWDIGLISIKWAPWYIQCSYIQEISVCVSYSKYFPVQVMLANEFCMSSSSCPARNPGRRAKQRQKAFLMHIELCCLNQANTVLWILSFSYPYQLQEKHSNFNANETVCMQSLTWMHTYTE